MHQSENPATGSDEDLRYANMDEKKRRRMIQNRDSARRCRMKKQQRLDELAAQVLEFQVENAEVARKINAASEMCAAVESENGVLRAQLAELTDRLRSLNVVLCIIDEVSDDVDIEIPEVPEVSTAPWKLPFPGTSISAASDVLRP